MSNEPYKLDICVLWNVDIGDICVGAIILYCRTVPFISSSKSTNGSRILELFAFNNNKNELVLLMKTKKKERILKTKKNNGHR